MLLGAVHITCRLPVGLCRAFRSINVVDTKLDKTAGYLYFSLVHSLLILAKLIGCADCGNGYALFGYCVAAT